MSGPRFVAIPADRLLERLALFGAGVTEKGGRYVVGRQGRETVVDLVPPGGRAQVRIYTSLAVGAAEVRACGDDAIRIVVGVDTPERFRPLGASTKVLRTAPAKAEDRVEVFLARLRLAVREAYAYAKQIPPCPVCGRAMALRTTKDKARQFWGCSGFPTCRGTMKATSQESGT